MQLTAGELAVVPATANKSLDDVFAIRFAMEKSDGVPALLVSNDKFRCVCFCPTAPARPPTPCLALADAAVAGTTGVATVRWTSSSRAASSRS